MRLADMNIALAVGLIAGSAIGSVTALEWQRAHEPVPDSVSFVIGAGVESVLYKCDDQHKCPSDLYKRSAHTLDDWHVTPPMAIERHAYWRPVGLQVREYKSVMR